MTAQRTGETRLRGSGESGAVGWPALATRVVRFHNVYGPLGTYDGGKEKAPAAICRKVALAPGGGEVEVWGDGKQTRSFNSFMYVGRLRRTLGWEPPTPLREGLVPTYRWIESELREAGRIPGAAVVASTA